MKVSNVSQGFSSVSFGASGNQKKAQTSPLKDSKKEYFDSFVKQAGQSAPMLLGFTALWSVLDYGTKDIPIQKSVLNNLAFFFLPVLIASSAVLAGIENKKTSKSTNS